MANYILFVFEGEKTERLIFANLKTYFFNNAEKDILILYHCGEIYSLYHKLKNDSGLDLFGVLQEAPRHETAYTSHINASKNGMTTIEILVKSVEKNLKTDIFHFLTTRDYQFYVKCV